MKVLAAILTFLTLSACAEVNSFRSPDGRMVYYLNCENSMRWLESCSAAAQRTCPRGYHQASNIQIKTQDADPALAQCREENEEREANGEAPLPCQARSRNEGFFVCN